MANKTLRAEDLRYFIGTESWYRHPAGITYTEGVKYVAEHGGAYWLIDEIAFLQCNPKVGKEQFQVWHLKVNLETHLAVLSCEDGNYNEVFRKTILWTDFPLPEITMWCTGGVIMLPSEY
jgi:hypothetical protein